MRPEHVVPPAGESAVRPPPLQGIGVPDATKMSRREKCDQSRATRTFGCSGNDCDEGRRLRRRAVTTEICPVRAIIGQKHVEIHVPVGRQARKSEAEYARVLPLPVHAAHVVPSTIQIRTGARQGRRGSNGHASEKQVASSQRSRPRSHWRQVERCRTVTRTARRKWL
jgi:hypothetical protein